MDIQAFIDTASNEILEEELCRLAKDHSPDSLATLEEFLRYHGRSKENEDGTWSISMKLTVIPLTAKALLQRGPAGVQSLVRALRHFSPQVNGTEVFAALWWAARGQFAPDPIREALALPSQPRPELVRGLTADTIWAALDAVNQFAVEARTNPTLFRDIVSFLASSYQIRAFGSMDGVGLDDFYDMMMSGAIKLSRALLQQFDAMIQQELQEEEYQVFLKEHPVFLDALAADVIPKQKLGIETVTDFVLRRYDNKYILVEIEKPQDRFFTRANHFTSCFTHAFGQVLDFQQWVDSHGEYAKTHMPGISSPRGLLVMGRRTDLTEKNRGKLHRFSTNSSAIEIVTFDDLLWNATSLYEAILRKGMPTRPGKEDGEKTDTQDH